MKFENLLEKLEYHAKNQPEKMAVYVLNPTNINVIDIQITYGELYHSVCQLAENIKTSAKPGERAILCYPTGIDFIIAFYACLLAKVIAVAVIVPSNLGLIKKFVSIAVDCQPAVILTDSITQNQYLQSDDFVLHLQANNAHQAKMIATDDVLFKDVSNGVHCPMPDFHPDELAFLQYTSGSTSSPKGVMISHGNLMTNIHEMARAFDGKKDSVGLNWLPHTHDMGLIGSFLHSVHMGAEIYLMSPFSFIRRPLLWLQALSKYKVHITGGPCFALKMCSDALKSEMIQMLDLSHLQYIIVGSEPISHQVVTRFFEQLSPSGLPENAFAPSYGLAEATLMVSTRVGLKSKVVDYGLLSQNLVTFADKACHSTTLVSCGYPCQTVKIVSPKTEMICLENEVGEIWLHGKSIAQGYWQNEQASQAYFAANIADDPRHYFKTGDLGFLHQDELYIVGRSKEVIIINGLNYYPQDIESSVLQSDEVLLNATCVAVRWRTAEAATDSFVILIRPSKRLVDEIKANLMIKIRKQILKEFQLVPHDIQFVQFSLPKTTSGKLQRTACAELYIDHCAHQRELYVEEV